MERSSFPPPPCGARLNRRASMSNCFKIKDFLWDRKEREASHIIDEVKVR